jgi:hypothetical protein
MSKKTFFQTEINEMLEREFNVNETMKVLTHNPWVYVSWGVSKKFKYQDKALLLQVNGYNHKGWVMVTLGWDDTYTFRLLNTRYREVYKECGCYFDELQDRIDIKVEKQAQYIR